MMKYPPLFLNSLGRLARDCHGNVAMMFGFMVLPLVLAAGVGSDYAQVLSFKNQLQNATDAAALAGASAYTATSGTTTPVQVATNYMNNAIKTLPSNSGVTFTVTPAQAASGANTVGYTVQVSASASVSNAFMAMAGIKTTKASVTATAENPVTTVSLSVTGFSSAACDANTVYWYPIPSGSTASTYVPSKADLTQIWTNTVKNPPAPSPITLTSSSEQIGFAMQNVTGQLCGYGTNSHGGTQGSSHMFYSNLFPPGKQAYSKVTTNNSLQVVALPAGQTLASFLPTLPAKNFTSNSPMAAPTCGQIGNQTYVYAWNDMGGTTDDLDYNDAAYTFSCAGVNGSTNGKSSGVVLIK